MHPEHSELLRSLEEKFDIQVPDSFSEQEIRERLEQRISRLIEKNSEEFFQLMYRIDIPESKLNEVLKEANAISILAKMIYERQLQKAKTRLQYRETFNKPDIDEELRW